MDDHEHGHHAHTSTRMTARVITVSDRSARGERADRSGPRAVELLSAAGFDVDSAVVPDGVESVQQALADGIRSGASLVITTGGTGLGPRDLTPEGTRPVIAQELPGIAELLRREGALHNPMAVISRGLAGVTAGNARVLIVNLPGSVAAVEEGLAVLLPVTGHILDQLRGGDH
ncbi:MogA/MoaB family molybdenum cofactor biosynthesis protein [Homoserinimonas sp. A447]